MTDPTEAISRMRKLLSDADAQISRPYQGQVLHDIRALLDRLDSAEAEVLEQAGAAEVSDEQIDSILWIGERATPEKLRMFARKVLALKAGGVA